MTINEDVKGLLILACDENGFTPDAIDDALQRVSVKGPNRNFQVYAPLDFLAAVTAHIPDRREHLVRYYGWYSSVQREKRRKQGIEQSLLKRRR